MKIRDKTIAKLAAQASRTARPARSAPTVDSSAVRELELYAENESALYNQKKSIIENIKRKMRSGKYDARLAPKLWLYWFDAAARRYVKEFGGDVAFTFPKSVRMAAAEDAAKDYAERIRSGEYGR
jgi:hypothetical protein